MMNIKPKKKNAMLQHKQQEEERKRKAEEEAAAVYAEFVEDFGGGGGDGAEAGRGHNSHRGGGASSSRRQRRRSTSGGGPRRSPTPGLANTSNAAPPSSRPAPPASLFGRGSTSSDDEGDGNGGKAPKATAPQRHFAAPAPAPPPPSAFAAAAAEPLPGPQPPSSRNIDRVVEAMRREQERRQSRQPSLSQKNADSTNLFVKNLAPDVTEAALLHEFAPFGAIASVKVMWPRDEAEARAKGGKNNGFVAFMRRADAERAMARMQGVTLAGERLGVEWGKAVELPAVPMWAGPGGKGGGDAVEQQEQQQQQQQQQILMLQQQALATAGSAGAAAAAAAAAGASGGSGELRFPADPQRSGSFPLPGHPHHPNHQLPHHHHSTTPLAPDAFRHRAALAPRVDRALAALHAAPPGVGDLVVLPPSDDRQRFILDSVALYVYRDGPAFERALAQSRRGDPDYAFLFPDAGGGGGNGSGGGGASGSGGGNNGANNGANNPNNPNRKPSPSPEHLYYRWRLYSLSQGDSLERWRVEPFVMVRGGPRWVPPPTTALAAGVVGGGGAAAAAAAASASAVPPPAAPAAAEAAGPTPPSGAAEAAGGGDAAAATTATTAAPPQDAATAAAAEAGERPLTQSERARLHALLAGLTASRASIAEAMAFCLDHSECAAAVSRALCASVAAPPLPPPAASGEGAGAGEEEQTEDQHPQTQTHPPLPPGARVARLFVISDVLHNAAGAPVRGALRYRARLLEGLPSAFCALGRVRRAEAAAGRTIVRAAMRQWVGNVLSGWIDRRVFPREYVDGLAFLFEAGLPPAVRGQSAAAPAGDGAGAATGGGGDGGGGGGANNSSKDTTASADPTKQLQPWEAAANAEVDRRCLASGLPLTVAEHCLKRCSEALAALDAWRRAEGGAAAAEAAAAAAARAAAAAAAAGGGAAGGAAGAAAAPAAPAPAPAPSPPAASQVPTSAWEAVDADEERRRLQSLPVSKLLLLQQQQQKGAEGEKK